MNFSKESSIELFDVVVEGNEFFHFSYRKGIPSRTKFSVNARTIDVNLDCNHEKYGAYSVEVFTKKVQAIYNSLHIAKNIVDVQKRFVRKMWLFKQLFDIFDVSIPMFIAGISKMIPIIYGKAINILDAEGTTSDFDEHSMKHAEMAMASIRKVHQKVVEVLTDVKFLKLLSPALLERFVKDAAPYMVAKIRCLPWIEPEIALMVAPNYNIYWTLFWHPFLKKNFNISSDICFKIAEYMPIKLRGEAFLDYFRRKYDARREIFLQGHAFDISKATLLNHSFNGCYVNKITILCN